MQITDLKMTCCACPSQWEAVTLSEPPEDVYIRYRYGVLSVRIDNTLRITIDHGDDLDGTMDTATMLKLLGFEVV